MAISEPLVDSPARPGESPLPDDIAPVEPLIELPECDSKAVQLLRTELGLNPLVAQTMVRRGVASAREAKEYFEPTELVPPELLPGAAEAATAISRHIKSRTRIAVHGDYDVDGVSATAIMVRTLSRLGADVTWHVPSRFEEGYGLSRPAIERLARDGAGLLVAVDCGITAVHEVAIARSFGMDVVICDHHRPGSALPDAVVAHPGIGEYACPDLCAAAVAFKVCSLLSGALGGDRHEIDQELELVGLATVCDVVALRGENRELVRRGIAAMRRSLRPGLRELMAASGVDRLKLDAVSFGFRLGPRLNAAGRMHSAEPAVELLLTESVPRAAELATELAGANARRKEIEQSILFEAETQAREQRDQYAIVVAGDGWHGGVLGIVAGRIAERFRRPCVALTIDHGVAKGSGRSGGIYDLHTGLGACERYLTRFGGHTAAAGVELDEHAIPSFRTALQAHARTHLTVDDLRPRVRVDAIADPTQLTIEAADAIEQLGPFGAGNREPALLVPGVTVTGLRRMGESGKHLKLAIAGRGGRHSVVAFNWSGPAVSHGDGSPAANIVVKLSRNEWRGVVEAQSRMVTYSPIDSVETPDVWHEHFIPALLAPNQQQPAAASFDMDMTVDRRGESPLAVLAELVGAGDPVVVLVNDPSLWADSLAAMTQIDTRFTSVRCLSYRDSRAARASDFALLAEPPVAPSLVAVECRRVVIAWHSGLTRVAASRATESLVSRAGVTAVYKALRDEPRSAGDGFAALRRAVPNPHTAAESVRVLEELGLVTLIRSGETVDSIEIQDAPRTELEHSRTFRSYSELREESTLWLASLKAED